MRNILLFILLLVGVWLFRRSLGRDARKPEDPPAADPTLTSASPEQMRACAHCGLIVPLSEGEEFMGDFFCSREHAQLGRQDPKS